MNSEGSPNSIVKGDFMEAETTGMSEKTANKYRFKERGLEASEKAAKADLESVMKFKEYFEKAEKETGVAKELIAAIASRGSRVGKALSSSGYGHDRHAYGVMQIEDRFHEVDHENAADSYHNIKQGAQILRSMIDGVGEKHPDWTDEQKLRGGIAAYNFGVKNVQTVKGIDVGTNGNDFSNDVVARAKFFRRQLFTDNIK